VLEEVDGGDVSDEDDVAGPEESIVEGVLNPDEEREEGEEFRLSLVGEEGYSSVGRGIVT